jgi:hypothetical protein
MNKLTKVAMVLSLLSSPLAFAGEDYPAANFEPKVLFSSDEASSSASSAPVAAKAVETVEVDSNYPAANFQPKVTFNDEAYKHSAAAPGTPSVAKSASASVSVAAVAESAPQAEKAEGSNNNLIGLALLAAVGFFLYNKKSAKAVSVESAQDYANAGDSTGVEKYLEKQGMNKTGVAKYLDKQTANPATGVAKYMAKQIVRDREAAAAKATGVEKYLRDNA